MVKQGIFRPLSRIYDHIGDPRIGPILLLGALMSFGTAWLMRNQPAPRSQSSQPSQSGESSVKKDETPEKQRARRRNTSNKDIPPSITDVQPKDAYQMALSDSDSG